MLKKRVLSHVVIELMMCVALMCTAGWAQQGAETTMSESLKAKMTKNMSVDFQDAPMVDVLKALSEQGDIDIILAPTVTGNVTAKFTDVQLDEALENILAVHGYGYLTTNSIVRVLPLEELALQKVRLVSQIYPIAYADITNVADAVKGMLTARGQMSMDQTGSHLMVTDVDTRVELVDAFINKADREVPQILVEARVYDVSCKDDEDLGFKWYVGTNTLYDADTGSASSGQINPFAASQFASGFTQAVTGNGDLRFGILHNDLDLDVKFRAIQDKTKARLLASPKILVLNNETAEIKIVKEIPYQVLTQSPMGGSIGTTKFKEVGVQLIVTPRVTRENKIRLDINPVFSVQSGTINVAFPGAGESSPQPVVDKREAHTLALIESGKTVVIGGLRKNELIEQSSKLPLLGDLPGVGFLFRKKAITSVDSELIVFITPTIVESLDMDEEATSAYRHTQENLTRPELPSVPTEK